MKLKNYVFTIVVAFLFISIISCASVSDYGDGLWHNVPETKTFSTNDTKGSNGYYRHYYTVYASGNWEIDITSSSEAAFSVFVCEDNTLSDYEYGYFYKSFNCTQKFVATSHIIISCHEDMFTLNPEYTITVKMK